MLTAADVEQKTFSTALRGYDLDEVDDFLDQIVVTIRTLNEQLEQARVPDGVSELVAPAPAPEPATAMELETEPAAEPLVEAPVRDIDVSAIGRALIAAQTAADRLLEDARDEAGKIVEEAKSEADSWSAEREAKRREAEAEIARLTDRVASVRSELSVLAGEVAEKLNEMDSVLNEATDTDVTAQGAGEEAGAHAEAVEVGHESEPAPEAWGYMDGESTPRRDADAPAKGGDHLDALLTGVVNDLQLPSDDSESEGGRYERNREEPAQDDEDEGQ